ncbi:MAG TPA: prephenate dehydratase domain-containing protein [Polyangiaceae bacterium]
MADKREQSEIRERIARIDGEILAQLEVRARLSKDIQSLLEGETSAVDLSEREWLERLEAQASGALPAEGLRAIFRQIRAVGRSIEQPVKVSYIGPEGGFCHEMARAYFGANAAFLECATPAEAFDEVGRGRAVFAVFPFESSIDGLQQPAVTALAQTDLVLVAERAAAAAYSMMSRTGNLGDVDKVYATPAAHAACERFLTRELPRASVIDVRSPVVAAQLAFEDHGSAAIVPETCGRTAELELARANVGDTPDLRFRYAVATLRPASRSGNDTTCLIFSVDDSAGALFDVLRHFAERGISLKKLQSRPVRSEGWDYVFYVEVSGHVTDRPVVTALEAVKRTTKYLKVLGSFPTES